MPLESDDEELTVKLVEALDPGAMLNDEAPKAAVKPDGIAAPRLKLDAVQPLLSLLVTVIV